MARLAGHTSAFWMASMKALSTTKWQCACRGEYNGHHTAADTSTATHLGCISPVHWRAIPGSYIIQSCCVFDMLILYCSNLHHPPSPLTVGIKKEVRIRELVWWVSSTGGVFGEVTSKVGNIGRKLRLSELLVEHLMKISSDNNTQFMIVSHDTVPSCLQIQHCVLSLIGLCCCIVDIQIWYTTGQWVAMSSTRKTTQLHTIIKFHYAFKCCTSRAAHAWGWHDCIKLSSLCIYTHWRFTL